MINAPFATSRCVSRNAGHFSTSLSSKIERQLIRASSVQFDPVKTTGTVSEENVLFYARRSKIGYEEIFFTRFTGKKRPGR